MADVKELEVRGECEDQIDAVHADEGNDSESPEGGENDVVAQVEQERERYQPTRLESFFAITKTLILRGIIMYVIVSLFRRPPTVVSGPNDVTPAKVLAFNMFENGTVMDLYVYISESEKFNDFSNPEALIWSEKGIIYGDWSSGSNSDGTRVRDVEIKTSEAVQNNGSLYLHVYVTRRGKSPDPAAGRGVYSPHQVTYNKKLLNKYKRLRYTKTHNLLTGETAATAEEVKKAETMKEEIVSHWHPNLTINMVTDQTNWIQGSVPPPLDEYIEFLPGGDRYKPVIYLNEYWNMLRDYQPINETTKTLQLTLTYQPLSLLKWQIYSTQTMRNKWTGNILGDAFVDEDDEYQDSLKEALLETSPYLLALTILISLLHSVFELLAFKNDIQFWNNRKSLEGLSVRSVFFNVFQSLIVMLYVFDNDTNAVVKISCVVGLCIEVWKIHKVMDININREALIFGVIPRFSFSDKGSYIESSTKEYDTLAFRYLSWALYPLLGGYAVYSLLYQEHRGWYSFVLNMLYGFLLTFGFIMMTPQLFINYKLKSVAHLPWRMMSYKFLNTFIDDIFAFVIKMPTLYRLGCFRDDIVFFIFLYQRWIYKTDPTRVNEFGFSGEMEREAAASQSGQLANGAAPAIAGAPAKDCRQKKED
ncbi:Cleft lip and palate transmembrane protein 1 [Cryptotermes secundus]|uniref:Cleft lip and palate transmembrane protein 1 n=1 Tax=Cryptotermes secundus TaxID=105785 RepID=A0A2J7PS95_9NEOP|nr:cleft lip and palate transmembrane protein 1 homolog [Cryptotermes secundus]PNF19201.1 Cleft lip and palate transmembrane protein 1 [Cryptotermes secundus]